ncbi:hypothetical protein P6281_06665 [Mycobacterium sp. 5-140-3-2]|uniref:hypothetical protein n=1 Tax=unclassified Mycobacterium TaxID=2642494 RepID=UPI002D76E7E0|nr:MULTISPECIES: hypothetical protein [unclassified Mycobacterium]WRU83601.1 hypothetical protein P6281_06665 [Mycobacterium sp. 5-140-3-2]WSE40253.1 hypothetical protein QGN28_19450 [Mycobacterium sp. 5-140-3-1]
MTDSDAAETAVGSAAEPTDMLPTLAQDSPSLAWADDDLDHEDPVPASWGAVFNLAAVLLVCGLIAAAITVVLIWGAR